MVNTDKTSLIDTSLMLMPGSKIRITRTRTPVNLLIGEALNQELSKVEKPAGIANPKDFRNEVVKFALRARAQYEGKNPSWTSYEKLRSVIEKRMFTQVEDLLPVISFESKKRQRHSDENTTSSSLACWARGYTQRQVRRLVEWYMRVNKAG